MKCKDCKYYVEYKTKYSSCHRYPPQVYYNSDDETYDTTYPEVFEDNWCGEFKLIGE